VLIVLFDNGGDNGWGNCGYNLSWGNLYSDFNGGGNGGYKKGDDCGGVMLMDLGDGGDGGGGNLLLIYI